MQDTVACINYNWIALIAGFLGIVVNLLSRPQTDNLPYFKSILKTQAQAILVSVIIWLVAWYTWNGGELDKVLALVSLPSIGAPNTFIAFILGYFGKSLWERIANLFAGKMGVKTPEVKIP